MIMLATPSLWGLLQAKRPQSCGDSCKQRDCIAVGTVASKANASLWGLLQAKALHGCWQCFKHSECMAVGKVASTASASLWALLQSCRRHRCGHHFFFCEGSNTNGWGVFPAGGHLRTGCKVNQVPSPRCDHAWHRRTLCPDHSNICKSYGFVHTLDDSERVRINWKR